MMQELLVEMRLLNFESKVKDLLSKEEGTMVVYVMDRNIYPSVKGFKPNLEMIYQKNREVANFKKGTTFQEMAQGIVDKYKDRDLYIVDMCSIRIRGGIFVAKDKNILNRISPITKAALRKLRKIRSKKAELVKYMSYVLNQKPIKK